jgi:hypothetical protein
MQQRTRRSTNSASGRVGPKFSFRCGQITTTIAHAFWSISGHRRP